MDSVTDGGVFCPLVTPFDGEDVDSSVDTDALAAHVEWLAAAGIDGLVPCGTTGEFASLTDAEREAVVRTTVDAAPDDVPVVAGAGATNVFDAAAWIDRVVGLGADAALLSPPYFHNASGVEGHRRFFETVLENSTGDVVLYNFPAVVGEPLPSEVAVDLAGRPRVAGLKDSSGDVEYLGRVLEEAPSEFPVFVGPDTLLGSGIAAGAAGGVNGLANVVPELLLDVYERAQAGDLGAARDRTAQLRPLLAHADQCGYVATVKAGLVARGPYRTAAVRPPLVAPEASARDAVAETVSDLVADG